MIKFKSLGTDISIQICDANLANQSDFEKEIRSFYSQKEKIFSRFDSESELSSLNGKLSQYNRASYDIIEIVRKSLEYNKKTAGFFDPRIINCLEKIGYKKSFSSSDFGKECLLLDREITGNLSDDLKIRGSSVYFGHRMDFSGIAKGYVTDQAAEFLKKKGYKNFLVDSGGDMRVLGNDCFGKNWKIDLEGFSSKKLLIELKNGFLGVATSGITRRKWEKEGKKFHHLINPKNPAEFDFSLKSVTVVAKNTEEADVWAKTLFLMGKDQGIKFSQKNNIKSFFLDYRGNLFISDSAKEFINIKSK